MFFSYASLPNQLYHFGHYIFAFLLLMFIWPHFIFKKTSHDILEHFFSNFLKIVFLYIILGYVLVLIKLFEVLSIFAILIFLAFRDYFRFPSQEKRSRIATDITVHFYNFLETGFRFKLWWKTWRGKAANYRKTGNRKKFKSETSDPFYKNLKTNLIQRTLLVMVFGCSAYLRFYDSWTTAAPAMSDGYVTLAWMKYIDGRILFHDGIYPQGFHIILSYLHKFAAIDALYVLKYTGPLVGIITMLGLYFFISRMYKNPIAGIVSLVVYGLAGTTFFGADWVRQAATNSQEFAFVFIFPTLYFSLRYVIDQKKQDLHTVFAGWSITGLVHTLGYAYLSLGISIILFLIPFIRLQNRLRVFKCLVITGIGTLVVSVLPLILGKLLNRPIHSSSENFLLRQVKVPLPTLHVWDFVALFFVFVSCLFFIILKKNKSEQYAYGFAVAFGILSFVLYEFGATFSHSDVLAVRARSLWILAVTFIIGIGWDCFWQLFRRIPFQKWLQVGIVICLMSGLIVFTRLQPIIPYKMQWDSEVQQYLHISSLYPDKTWTIFAENEEYALVYGKGYHQQIQMLLQSYDPTKPGLTRFGQSNRDHNISNNIYIFEQKHVYRVSKDNSIYIELVNEYNRREQEMVALQRWIQLYQQHNQDLQIFYDDPNVRIYYLHVPEKASEKLEKIWGS